MTMASRYLRGRVILLMIAILSFVVTFSLLYNVFYLNILSPHSQPYLRSNSGLGSNNVDTRSKNKAADSNNIVSALNQRWMTWQTIDSPGKYRSCVPYPTPDNVFHRELSGGLVDTVGNMTITRCLQRCISSEFTYAGLTRGTQCYCTNMYNSSTLLTYVDSSLCDVPCAGNRDYDCGGKTHFSLYRTSVPDPRCSGISVGKPGSFPKLIALASYPRSGNTWTRQLVEYATGFSTGSVYWKAEGQQAISSKVFKGGNVDYKSKRTICVKTHMMDKKHTQEFDGAILLMRNPHRTLVAEVFRLLMFSDGSNGSIGDGLEYFKSQEWQDFVDKESRRWHETNIQWIRNAKRLLVIHYELLESDTQRQLARIVQFLDQPVNDERISCAVQDNPSSLSTGIALGNHGVKTRAYLTNDPFTPSMHTALDAFILSVNESLVARGQDPIPTDYNNIKVY